MTDDALQIDLARHASGDVKVYAGRDRGRRVRAKYSLDEVDAAGRTVNVHVPGDTYALNTSFFLGMFGDSIGGLGEREFLRRYVFTGKDITRVRELAFKRYRAP